ncbi:hypothetical protein HYDPIDRAFT_101831, partial [Hydnomerulius pinastri MD-312]
QLERRQEDIDQAAQTLRNACFESNEQFEKKFQNQLIQTEYQTGDLILVQNSQVEKELNHKTKPRYLGPFKINRQTQAGAYIIEELDRTVSQQGIAAFRIIPYISRSSPELAQLVHIQE